MCKFDVSQWRRQHIKDRVVIRFSQAFINNNTVMSQNKYITKSIQKRACNIRRKAEISSIKEGKEKLVIAFFTGKTGATLVRTECNCVVPL